MYCYTSGKISYFIKCVGLLIWLCDIDGFYFIETNSKYDVFNSFHIIYVVCFNQCDYEIISVLNCVVLSVESILHYLLQEG